MLTLYHATNARSFNIKSLIYAMGIEDEVNIQEVTISRPDGSGGPDPQNPHPEGKVPALQSGDKILTEVGAIAIYLATLFPSDMAPALDSPEWGEFLTWVVWNQSVLEPVGFARVLEIEHPALTHNYRDMEAVNARLSKALENQDYLMGDKANAADFLIAPIFNFAPQLIPNDPKIQAWLKRVDNHPAILRALQEEQAPV